MDKVYVLQKDCLDAKKGDEYYTETESPEDGYVNRNRNTVLEYIDRDYVENNPDWFKENEQPKDWVVQSFINKHGAIANIMLSGKYDYAPNSELTAFEYENMIKVNEIHSVKRTSDNEVFTIGDTVTIVGEITGFQIDDNKIKALTHAKGNWQFLNSISHIKKEQPVPIDIFIWDEETAKEYGKFCILNKSWLQWEDFKQSKSTPKEEKIIIESILCIIASEPGGKR